MNSLITIISMLAVAVSVTCNIPQLVTMLRKRSSSGQSILGWSLGFTANFALAFVNGFGYHAAVLVAGNVLSATACVTAICLVRLYRGGPAAPAAAVPAASAAAAPPASSGAAPSAVWMAPPPATAPVGVAPAPATARGPVAPAPATTPVPVAPPPHAVTDMRTQEFVLLRDAVLAEHRRRTGGRRPALA